MQFFYENNSELLQELRKVRFVPNSRNSENGIIRKISFPF